MNELTVRGIGMKLETTHKCLVCLTNFVTTGVGKGKIKYCTDQCKKFARKPIPKNLLSQIYSKFKNINNCQICDYTFKSYTEKCVDHCHNTGYVKGVLCSNCNAGIGYLQDDYDIIHKALDYLTEEHFGEQG